MSVDKRGLFLFRRGYLNRPHATREVMEDGFFKTGDIATRDNDGFIYIVDRRKEIIKYKGYQGQYTIISAPHTHTPQNHSSTLLHAGR